MTYADRAHATITEAAGEVCEWSKYDREIMAMARESDAEIERLRRMVRDAYNSGFCEGMREHTSSRGGVPWSDCKFRAAV